MKRIHRRTLLRAGLAAAATGAGAGTLAACTGSRRQTTEAFVAPDGDEVRAAEAKRNPGTIRDVRLAAVAGPVDLGGPNVNTWTYDGVVPGTPIRVKAGEVVRATLTNHLPEHTTIHWHGIALRNDADGIPDITQRPVAAGAQHIYQFTAAHPGTYWFHPHAGAQLDRGLYAPLIVEDPREPLTYDDEWIVVLDDWLDGVQRRTPDAQLAELRKGMSAMMGGQTMGGTSSTLLGGDAGDVTYPTTCSTDAYPPHPAPTGASPAAGCGCASSTPAATPPSGWPWAGTRCRSPTPTGSLSNR